ncbi:MAG: cation:proton antiporter [Planctomycetaceae bacterium]|jgi:CPA2 family monovalent cation:H+ antiporter-2|nr:cation:proton antiporter [Planctomycetaceae bacterium]
MDDTGIIQRLLLDLLIILSAGFCAGVVCKQLRIPMVVGYLLIGAVIGNGVLGIFHTAAPHDTNETISGATAAGTTAAGEAVPQKNGHSEHPAETEPKTEVIVADAEEVEKHIIDQFAHLGANLLLFAIGIHFSPSELVKIWRHFLAGGLIQMLGVILPFGLLFYFAGGDWKVGIVLGSAVSLSSTVLVFKSLEDMGLATSLSGLRAVAILLFQDVAIVPLLVLISILSALAHGGGNPDSAAPAAILLALALKASVFVTFIVVLRMGFVKFGVPPLLALRNLELIVLFTMILLIGVCAFAGYLGLPGALGALAAGVVLSDTRLTHQISAITVAMRETFSAIFFVSLGALFDPHILFHMPAATLGTLLGCLILKTAAAGGAFWLLGLRFIPAMAMGLGLSQLGELSFILIAQGYAAKMFDYHTYQIILFTALTSILLTPLFLRIALNISREQHQAAHGSDEETDAMFPEDISKRAIVVGLGPIGGRVVTFLETTGFEVTLIDMNPVNLHPYAQHGFQTIAGNANDAGILQLAEIRYVTLVVISVPDDTFTEDIVEAVRRQNDHCIVMARCRYTANISKLEKLGANLVLCGETELANTAIRTLRKLLR